MTNETTYITDDYLRKKARRKFIGNAIAGGLARHNKSSPLIEKYRTTFGCCHELHVSAAGEMSAKFHCHNRWCPTCASIKMAVMIDGYLPEFEPLHELQFVTLTMRDIHRPAEIIPRLEEMQKIWRRIADLARKKRVGFIGLRKTELKIGDGGGYHPHYHIIVSGRKNAQWLVWQWLTQVNGAGWWSKRHQNPRANPKAQQRDPVRNLERGLIELFKYAAKATTAEGGDDDIVGAGSERPSSPYQMDKIYCALFGRRLFQPFGGLRRAVDEEATEELTPDQVRKCEGFYQWAGSEWWHEEWGQPLTGYVPTSNDLRLSEWGAFEPYRK
jgi:hypothetical protein